MSKFSVKFGVCDLEYNSCEYFHDVAVLSKDGEHPAHRIILSFASNVWHDVCVATDPSYRDDTGECSCKGTESCDICKNVIDLSKYDTDAVILMLQYIYDRLDEWQDTDPDTCGGVRALFVAMDMRIPPGLNRFLKDNNL